MYEIRPDALLLELVDLGLEVLLAAVRQVLLEVRESLVLACLAYNFSQSTGQLVIL